MTTLSLLLGLSLAHADAIRPPPECPLGSTGRSTHAGQWCEANEACATLSCDEGQACLNATLCIVEETVPCGGRRHPDAEPCTFDRKRASALADGKCAKGAPTSVGQCAAAGPPPPSGLPGVEGGPGDAPSTEEVAEVIEDAPTQAPTGSTEVAPTVDEPTTGCRGANAATLGAGFFLMGMGGLFRRRED